MKLQPIIDRAKDQALSLAGRVGGISALAAAVDASDDFALPHAFVVRLEETTQPPEEKFGVVVCVSNAQETAADDELDDIRTELLAALSGWAPTNDRGPMEYRGFANLEMSRAAMWRRFDFVAPLNSVRKAGP